MSLAPVAGDWVGRSKRNVGLGGGDAWHPDRLDGY